ncbi:MAG: hypothetical protein M3O70_28030, partial [Actinomycetota bacterium]|nr:hypothetical protein [Actinomycetota bacterium]
VVLEPRRGQLAAVVPVNSKDGSHMRAGEDEARLTTRGLLLVEQGAVRSALAPGRAGRRRPRCGGRGRPHSAGVAERRTGRDGALSDHGR